MIIIRKSEDMDSKRQQVVSNMRLLAKNLWFLLDNLINQQERRNEPYSNPSPSTHCPAGDWKCEVWCDEAYGWPHDFAVWSDWSLSLISVQRESGGDLLITHDFATGLLLSNALMLESLIVIVSLFISSSLPLSLSLSHVSVHCMYNIFYDNHEFTISYRCREQSCMTMLQA